MKPAYYNEINPLPNQTLRNLIAARHIAPGDVDEKSIEDAHGSACSHSPCRRAASMVFCEGMFTQASTHGLVQLLPDTSGIPVAQAPPASHASAILKACRPDERSMLQFWFETSLCPGELQALQWSYIDWERAIAWIELNQVAGVIKGPKTAAGIRDVELSAEALSALRAQRPISELKGERIWLNPRTSEPWSTDAQIRKTLWQPVCKRAEVEYRNPYQVRHTYASALLTAGANPWYAASQLGHEDVEVVFRTYGKFIRDDYQKPKPEFRIVGEK